MRTGLAIEATQATAARIARDTVPAGVNRALLRLARQSRLIDPRIMSYQNQASGGGAAAGGRSRAGPPRRGPDQVSRGPGSAPPPWCDPAGGGHRREGSGWRDRLDAGSLSPLGRHRRQILKREKEADTWPKR